MVEYIDNIDMKMSPRELSELANALLKENGSTIFGRPKSEVSYEQTKFENRMQTGAYSRNQSKRK